MVMGAPKFAYIMPLLHEALHMQCGTCERCPVPFHVQFKVLVINFKALYGTGPGYMWDCRVLRASSHHTRSDRVCTLLDPKYCHLMGAKKHTSAIRNTLPLRFSSFHPSNLPLNFEDLPFRPSPGTRDYMISTRFLLFLMCLQLSFKIFMLFYL